MLCGDEEAPSRGWTTAFRIRRESHEAWPVQLGATKEVANGAAWYFLGECASEGGFFSADRTGQRFNTIGDGRKWSGDREESRKQKVKQTRVILRIGDSGCRGERRLATTCT